MLLPSHTRSSRWAKALATAALAMLGAACAGRAHPAGRAADDDAAVDAAADHAVADDARSDAIADTSTEGSVDASGCPVALQPLLTFDLAAGAFPNSGHPDVAVHAPAGFDACSRPGLIVFFHGYDNCAVNVIGSTDGACTSGGAIRPALHLADQLDAARVNALLVVVELAFDSPTSDPGQLANANGLRDLLHELFADHLGPLLGRPLDIADLSRVAVATHSGGYRAAALTLGSGGVPQIRELDAYSSLYGDLPTFNAWIGSNLDGFDPTASDNPYRFVDAYTPSDGTLVDSESLAADVATLLGDAGRADWLFESATAAPLSASDLKHPLVFKPIDTAFDDLPRTAFETVTRASGFQPLP